MATVEVLSGPERRRRWTTAEKLRIVQESFAAGATASEVARRHDVHPHQLYGWRQQARSGALTGALDRPVSGNGTAAFAAVAVAPEPTPAPVRCAQSGVIEIDFSCGARVRITGAADGATVSAVVAALAGARR
jgi:transposase